MINYFYAYITSFITMLALDAVWLGLVAPKFYKKHIGFIMADKPNLYIAGIFYLVFIAGLTYFVAYPAWQNSSSVINILLTGGFFGLVTYATYDLTNQATLKNWPAIVTIVDIAWGALLCAAVSLVAVFAIKIFTN